MYFFGKNISSLHAYIFLPRNCAKEVRINQNRNDKKKSSLQQTLAKKTLKIYNNINIDTEVFRKKGTSF